MIWNGKYVSVNAIIEKVYRDMNMINELDLGNAVEWAGEAIEFIGAPMTLREIVGLIEIKHRKGKLPLDMHLLITAGAAPNQDCKCAKKFIQMRYSTDAYHMFCSQCMDDRCDSDLTYKVNDDYIFTNFDEGTVRVSYKAIPVDENGYPLIPDDVKFKNAVAYHIMWKLAFIKLMRDEINRFAYEKIERDRDWYIGAAQTRGNMPNPDLMESIKNNWIRLIKKINQHGDGFKSAGHQEERYTHNSATISDGRDNNNSDAPTFFHIKGEEDETNNC